MLTGCVSGRFHTGKVSYFAYPATTPLLCSWYICDRHVAILPEPGPGAVTTTSGRVVSMNSFLPKPSSLAMCSMS